MGVKYTVINATLGNLSKTFGAHAEPKYTHAAVHINEEGQPDKTVIVWYDNKAKADKARKRKGLVKYGVFAVRAEVIKPKPTTQVSVAAAMLPDHGR